MGLAAVTLCRLWLCTVWCLFSQLLS